MSFLDRIPGYERASEIVSNALETRAGKFACNTLNVAGKTVCGGAAATLGLIATPSATVATARLARDAGLFGQPIYRGVETAGQFVSSFVPLSSVNRGIGYVCEHLWPAIPAWVKGVAATVTFGIATYRVAKPVVADVKAAWAARPWAKSKAE